MVRPKRVTLGGYVYHALNRANGWLRIFKKKEDFAAFEAILAEGIERVDMRICGYCIIPNHTHLEAIPKSEDGLRRAIGEAHRRYTRRVNFREGWRGHLWQGRFASFVMDEPHLIAAVRYIELNPVRAGLVSAPSDYPWSSARAHLHGRDDSLVRVSPMLALVGNWRRLLCSVVSEEELREFRAHERTGRPLGDEDFVRRLERKLGRVLQRKKPGRRRRDGAN